MRIVLEVILPWGGAGVYSGGVLWVRCGRTTGTGPAVCFFFLSPATDSKSPTIAPNRKPSQDTGGAELDHNHASARSKSRTRGNLTRAETQRTCWEDRELMGNGNSSEFNGLDKPISANKVRKYFHKNFVGIGAKIRSTKKKNHALKISIEFIFKF